MGRDMSRPARAGFSVSRSTNGLGFSAVVCLLTLMFDGGMSDVGKLACRDAHVSI